jgi:hypothetical protein
MTRAASDDAPFSALAFNIMTDPFVGTLTFCRICFLCCVQLLVCCLSLTMMMQASCVSTEFVSAVHPCVILCSG